MDINFIRKINYLEDYKYSRFIDADTRLMVSVDDFVEKDSIISKGNVSKMLYRINISDFASNFKKYIIVSQGEVVSKGDIVMKKRSKYLYSPVDGIIDLSSVDTGVILVRSFPEDVVNKSNIKGKVSYISHDKTKIVIDTNVLKIDLKYIFGENINANLKYLCDDKGFLKLEDINSSCIGNIIYVGNLITSEIIKKSLVIGVSGIIGNGIELKNNENIEDLINSIPITVGIIDGFGLILNTYFYSLVKYNNKPSLIDQYNQSLIIFVDEKKDFENDFYIKEVEKDDKVQIFNYPYWGATGIVNSFDSKNFKVNIILDSRETVSVHPDEIVGIIET